MAAQLYPGIVKAVLSGDTVIIMGADASKGPPPEKVLSLTGISAPRLGNKSTEDAVRARLAARLRELSRSPDGPSSSADGCRRSACDSHLFLSSLAPGLSQPFAWGAREFLRKLAVGKRVTFHVEAQSTPARSFGAVFMEDGTPLTTLLVAAGWAKPRQGAPQQLHCLHMSGTRRFQTQEEH